MSGGRPRLPIGRLELHLAALQVPRPITYADLAAMLGCSRVTVANALSREGMTLADLAGVSFPGFAGSAEDRPMQQSYPTRIDPEPLVPCSACGQALRLADATRLVALTRAASPAYVHRAAQIGSPCHTTTMEPSRFRTAASGAGNRRRGPPSLAA